MLLQLKTASLENRLVEICAFVGRKDGGFVVHFVRNNHAKPSEFFEISPLDYLKFKKEHELVALFHSHVRGDSSATDFDKLQSMNLALPFLIYSISEDKFSIFSPENCKPLTLEELQ